MLKLIDFFQPLNPLNLGISFALLGFFDILGTFVIKFFVKQNEVRNETRLINWLVGCAFFVFVWFLTGFVIEPNRINIVISIVILLLISLPSYLVSHEYSSLYKTLKSLLIPILLVLPFFPTVLVKSSLPPYLGDEMTYHFISPFELLYKLKYFWTFNGGLYMNIPRQMENLYILTFSLSRTYAVARFLQFLILITSLLIAYLLIKKNFGFLTAFLFTFIFISLPLGLSVAATIGYVDVPAYSFLLIGLIFSLVYIFYDKTEYLILSMMFWAMSIGTKYTTLTPFVISNIVVGLASWFKNRSLSKILNQKVVVKLVVVFIVFGGYWYIKNFIAYGNPLYPFIFPCWGRYAVDCRAGSSFFGTWTEAVNLQTLGSIFNQILPDNIFLNIGLVISSTIIVFFGGIKERGTLLIIGLLFSIEMLILKYTSGFFLRYQQHLIFELILAISLLATIKFNQYSIKIVQYSVIAVLLLSCFRSYNMNVLNLTSSVDEQKYFLGITNIYDWIDKKFPDTSRIVRWCESPPGGKVLFAQYDPDMIWYSDDEYIRSFFLNCYWGDPNLKPVEWTNFRSISTDRKLQFWTVSINRCVKPESLTTTEAELADGNNKTDDFKKLLNMRELNNAIICNSQSNLPNLYYFDYKKLK